MTAHAWFVTLVGVGGMIALAVGQTSCSMRQPGKAPAMLAQRSLASYQNDDGRAPNGLDDNIDDTSAIRAALADGPGVVSVPAGVYRWGEVAIPEGVTLVGAGRGTVVRLVKDAKRVFVQEGVSNWRLRDMLLDGGQGATEWAKRQDVGQNGIEISRCSGFEVSGIVANNFSGSGISISYNAPGPYCHWATDSHIFNIVAAGNHTGIRFDTRSEYMNASMLTCQGNVIGCTIHGGNVKVANSNFTNNLTGILIEDHENGSHGAIANCLVNHNQQLALRAKDVRNGMLVENCCFFGGGIEMENCQGIGITGGIIACNVIVKGDKANRIAGNYMIIRGETFDIAPCTLVKDNYTENGSWEVHQAQP